LILSTKKGIKNKPIFKQIKQSKMKIKVIKQTEVETEIEVVFPVYIKTSETLYRMVLNEKEYIEARNCEWSGTAIEFKSNSFTIARILAEHEQCSREVFMAEYKKAMDVISNLIPELSVPTLDRQSKEKWILMDRVAGNKIESFATEKEAKEALKEYENLDRGEGIFTPDFYEVCEIKETEVKSY
jgi:hypothetical protein